MVRSLAHAGVTVDRIPFCMRLDCGICVVRDWAAGDKPALLAYANNPNIWRNLADKFPHPYTERDADAWLSSVAQVPEPSHWAIEVEGGCVGGVGVTLREDIYRKSGLFGYWLAEPFWGRGIMTAAVRAVAPYAMSRFGLVRLEAAVFEWNFASMRVLEKCGFYREGVLRASVFKDGKIGNSVVYALVDKSAI